MTVQEIYIKRSSLFVALFIGSIVLESIFPSFTFVKYLIPGIFLAVTVFSFSKGPALMEKKAAQNLALVGGIILFSFCSLLVQGQKFYGRFFTEAFLLLAPLVVLLFWKKSEGSGKIINLCIYGSVVAYAIQVLFNLQTMEFESLSEAIRNSYMPTETGNIAFVFGLFFIYCFYQDKKKLLLLAILVFFSFKRINFLAVPMVILLSGFLTRRFNTKNLALLLLAVNGLLIILLRNFFLGNFDNFIVNHFNMSANVLSMGRETILAAVNEHLKSTNWLGIGLGKSVELLTSSIQLDGIKNLHSDLIKYYIELGPLMFCLWVYFFYRINAVSKVGFALTFYLNMLFITDNVSVYFFVMTTFYYLVAANKINKKETDV